jgi:hypothetical protein
LNENHNCIGKKKGLAFDKKQKCLADGLYGKLDDLNKYLKSEIPYQNGLKHGEEKVYFKNGKVEFLITWHKNAITSCIEYDKAGNRVFYIPSNNNSSFTIRYGILIFPTVLCLFLWKLNSGVPSTMRNYIRIIEERSDVDLSYVNQFGWPFSFDGDFGLWLFFCGGWSILAIVSILSNWKLNKRTRTTGIQKTF